MDLFFALFPEKWPDWLRVALSATIPAVLLLTFMAVGPIVYVYVERKIAGFMQDRLGPTRVGPYGLLQTVADAIKLMFKEALPAGVDTKLFILAPCLVVLGAFLSFVVLPFGSRLQTMDLNVGLFYVVAVSSISTVGLIMAGWASNNKYALFGAMRSAAQIVSYEIPAVMVLLSVVILVGSLSLQDIVWAQNGGLTRWFLFRYFPLMPVAFVVFFTAGLAECARPSTSRRRRASWWPASTPSTAGSSSPCSSWPIPRCSSSHRGLGAFLGGYGPAPTSPAIGPSASGRCG